MLPKPDKCKGCPFYGDGKGFVPDTINNRAEVFIYAQNPGGSEESGRVQLSGGEWQTVTPQPLIGKTGQMMDRTFLPLAGLTRDDVSLGNSLRCRYKHADALPPLTSPIVREAMEKCHREHFKLPEQTKIIVTQGEYALYAMTQHGRDKYDKVSDWRGYVLPFEPVGAPSRTHITIYQPAGLTVLATYHLAYLFRDPTASLVTRLDWAKVPKILKGTWPKNIPDIHFGPPSAWPDVSAFDTEFDPKNRHFICYSLAYKNAKGEMTVRVSDTLSPGAIMHDKHTVIMHNAPADIPFLDAMFLPFDFEDTMHAHAVLWSDLPHDLGFLGSIYSPINRWKHLTNINPQVYSAADAYVTWAVWEGLSKEFKADNDSWKVYHDIQVKLVPIIMASEAKGIRINPEKAEAHYMRRHLILEELAVKAQAVTGWPINLRSNTQVGHHLYEVEGLLRILGGK